jgi:hypothetical protein
MTMNLDYDNAGAANLVEVPCREPKPMTAKEERTARKHANDELYELGKLYHDGLPLMKIDNILTRHGFNATEDAIYCGREGKSNEKVGERTWLTLNWYKMESGRYEIVAYLS